MTAAYTPSVLATIRRNAGRMRPDEIAGALGWPPAQLASVAAKHGIDLRLIAMRASDGARTPTFARRVALGERRSEHFGIRLRPGVAKVILAKAAERYAEPGELLALVIEGAMVRGKIDEMASAARELRGTAE